MMAKLATIGVLLCATVLTAECVNEEKPKLSRHLSVTLPKSTTVGCGDAVKGSDVLWTVSVTKSNVHVNSSDPNNKPCDLAIDPDKDSIEGELKVTVTNRFMFILGEHGVEKVDGEDKTKYTLLIVGLNDCSLIKVDVPLAKVSNSLPDMVVTRYGVSLFFPKFDTCAPCKYSNRGEKETVSSQIPAPTPSPDGFPYSHHMAPLGFHKYLYAQNMEGDKAMLKVIDNENMTVLAEKQVDFPVDSIVKLNSVAPTVGICSKKYDDMLADITAYKEINCMAMNENLETYVPIKVSIEPLSRPISSVTYETDKRNGKIYVGFASDQNLGVLIYSNEGKLLKSYDLGKIDERFEKYEHQPMFYSPYSHWDVHGFIAGKEYCLVTKQVSYYDKHEVDLNDVRCIATLE